MPRKKQIVAPAAQGCAVPAAPPHGPSKTRVLWELVLGLAALASLWVALVARSEAREASEASIRHDTLAAVVQLGGAELQEDGLTEILLLVPTPRESDALVATLPVVVANVSEKTITGITLTCGLPALVKEALDKYATLETVARPGSTTGVETTHKTLGPYAYSIHQITHMNPRTALSVDEPLYLKETRSDVPVDLPNGGTLSVHVEYALRGSLEVQAHDLMPTRYLLKIAVAYADSSEAAHQTALDYLLQMGARAGSKGAEVLTRGVLAGFVRPERAASTPQGDLMMARFGRGAFWRVRATPSDRLKPWMVVSAAAVAVSLLALAVVAWRHRRRPSKSAS